MDTMRPFEIFPGAEAGAAPPEMKAGDARLAMPLGGGGGSQTLRDIQMEPSPPTGIRGPGAEPRMPRFPAAEQHGGGEPLEPGIPGSAPEPRIPRFPGAEQAGGGGPLELDLEVEGAFGGESDDAPGFAAPESEDAAETGSRFRVAMEEADPLAGSGTPGATTRPRGFSSRPPSGLGLLARSGVQDGTDGAAAPHSRQNDEEDLNMGGDDGPGQYPEFDGMAAEGAEGGVDGLMGGMGGMGGGSDSEAGSPPEPVPHLMKQQRREFDRERRRNEKKEKEKLLFRLYALRKKGAATSKRYTMDSDIDDMRDEYQVLKQSVDMRASRAFSGKMLVMIVTAIEFLNERFDPFDLYLDGWSESIHENIGDYDEVFDQLYEKYKERMSVAPEVKLLLMLGGSAFMFHMTNSMFRPTSVPGANLLPQEAVQKMMAAAQREVAPSVPVASAPSRSERARVGFSVPGADDAFGGAPPAPPPRRFSPPPSPPRPPSRNDETAADILQYITETPRPVSGRAPPSPLRDLPGQLPAAGPGPKAGGDAADDDGRSVSTVVSIVTQGGTRRRKRRKRKRVMTLAI